MSSKYIVDKGIQGVVDLLADEVWEIAVGLGSTPAWVTNETLENEYSREDATVTATTTTLEGDTLKFEATFIFDDTITLTEVGIFKKAPDSFMLCRIVLPPNLVPALTNFPVIIYIPLGR